MELFIQGRKDGYNVLFPHPTPTAFFKFASDIQSTAASSDSRFFGKSFYSIAFADGGCILSKYIVGFDQARGAVGNIGFSVFVPKEKKLPGYSAKELLDGLVEGYRANYMQNNIIPASQVENWTIFANLANMYDSKLAVPEDVESFEPGTAVPAYYYYTNGEELEKILDAPYQNEFKGFKQVFLLDGCYNGTSENPLLCQKYDVNANLTGKVDFRNIKLKLAFNDNRDSDVQINIEQIGSSARLFNNSKVRLHDSVRISWNKAFHEKRVLEGILSDIAMREPGLVSLDEIRRTVTVSSSVNLPPQKKALRIFAVSAMQNSSLPNAEITATNVYSHLQKIADGGVIFFEGDEIGQSWLISAKSGLLSSDDKNEANTIVPGRIDTFTVRLHEDFVLTVKGIDENGHEVNEISIALPGVQPWFTQSSYRKFTFRDAQINRPVEIVLSKKQKDGTKLEGRQTVTPGVQEVVEIVMRKAKPVVVDQKPVFQPKYHINAGKHGYKAHDCPGQTFDPDGEDVVRYIKADLGYEFDHFEVQLDTLVAVYNKKAWMSALPWILAVVASAAIGAGVCLLFFKSKDKEAKTEITTQSDTTINQHSADSSKTTVINPPASASASEPDVKKDTKASDAVSGPVPPDQHKSVEKEERKAKSEESSDIEDGPGKRWRRDKVQSQPDETSQNPVKTDDNISPKPVSPTPQPESGAKDASSGVSADSPAPDNIDAEIIAFLKGTSLSKLKLSEYQNKTSDASIKKSIGLVNTFWSYVKIPISDMNNMMALLNQVKIDPNLKNSALAGFLNQILQSSDSFGKFNAITGKAAMTSLAQLQRNYNSSAQ